MLQRRAAKRSARQLTRHQIHLLTARIVVRSGANPCLARISCLSFCFAKTGSIGIPLTVILGAWYAERFEIGARFVNRDKVMLVMMDQPHRMDVEVSDDDHLAARKAFLRFQPRDDLGWQKVSADDQIRMVARAGV